MVKNPPAMLETRVQSMVGKITWRRAWSILSPVFLPGESHGQRSLEGHSPWGHKESDTSEATLQACMPFSVMTNKTLKV